MLEIIKRHEGCESIKERVDGKPQISFNDWGHIAIRAVQTDVKDVLVVLDAHTSTRLIDFCKQIKSIPNNELPF